MSSKKRAPTLNPFQLRHVLNVTLATSRHPARDCLAILATHSAGLRVTELARLEIRDILWPSGRLRDEVLLRAEITKNCKSRIVFLTAPKLRQAMESYLDFRIKGHKMAKIEIEVIQTSIGLAVWAADHSEQYFSVPSGTSIETIFLCLDAYNMGKAKALAKPFALQEYEVVRQS